MPLISRREALAGLALPAAAQPSKPGIDINLVKRHDKSVDSLLARQTTSGDPARLGGLADQYGIYFPHSPAGLLDSAIAAWLTPESAHYRSAELMGRMRLAAGWLARNQLPSGNFDLPTTNFNSPPDTGFVTHSLGGAAILARRNSVNEVSALVEPVLRRMGGALSVGGVHTPNHRWVVCEALSQLNELFGETAYLRRIDQWLAEGIDIDGDGQYNERSTTIYNAVTNRAFVVMAHKLKRWDLLEPVRKNLDAMLYLLHADGEVVTEISSRQDANERGDMSRYWFPLRYMALRDQDGRLSALASRYEASYASLPLYLQYPELSAPLPAVAPLPEDFEKDFPAVRIARVRRGPLSASVVYNGNSRFFTFRHGDCVVNAVRLVSAFFGIGQFTPASFERTKDGFMLAQKLEGPYYQPFNPARRVAPGAWGAVRWERKRSEVCSMSYRAVAREEGKGFSLEIEAGGTDGVPLAIEISLRHDGELGGCVPAPGESDAWLLKDGAATYRTATHAIRFGPGLGAHTWTRLRGALPQLPGRSVYLCGYTPFRHTLRFEVA